MDTSSSAGYVAGPAGQVVAANVKRLRKSAALTLRALAADLETRGHRIGFSALSAIENGNRRVDADDLIALSLALSVAPIALLLPHSEDPTDTVTISPGSTYEVGQLWEWGSGGKPLAGRDTRGFQSRSLPYWFDEDDPAISYHAPGFEPGIPWNTTAGKS